MSTLSAGIAEAANFTTFTDRAAWEAAVGSFSEEDFNDFTEDTSFNGSSLDVGDFTLINDLFQIPTANFINTSFTVIDGTPNVDVVAFPSSFSRVELNFDSPITAFGADFQSVSEGNFTTQFVIGSDTIDIPDTPLGFFGFVSDMSFSEMLLEGPIVEGFVDRLRFDNVVYEQASTPEPVSVLGLLAFGAVGASSMLKRK
ncbi:hypothetical protein [Okeania sp. SIO2C9]|uniref:hypothetical protein n=1 Tax=Okeania sp. SIO2C9 TaxID=2607791 RepID=UPI0025E1B9CB|nr:hypothetical protein [Okeania sp. SIO2C9]